MNRLDSLELREKALLSKLPMPGVDSGMAEDARLLLESKIYDESRYIYSQYIDLAEHGDIEALKRALFYAWYQLSEPHWLTGISQLPDEKTNIVVELLEKHIEQGNTDGELLYMLPYYMQVCGYYLERFYPIPCVQKASAIDFNNAREAARNSNVDWGKRGQMGVYWG